MDDAVVRKPDPDIHGGGGAPLIDCGTTLTQAELTTVTKPPLKEEGEDLIIPLQTTSEVEQHPF